QWVGAERARTWDIEPSESTLRVEHEAVIWNAEVRLGEEPFNRSCRVDAANSGARAGSCARTRSIERGDSAVLSAHETVKHRARVSVLSHDHPCRVDGTAKLYKSVNGARWIERGDSAVLSAHETVKHSARITVESRDHAARVDVQGDCDCGARRIEGGDYAVLSAHEAVKHIV